MAVPLIAKPVDGNFIDLIAQSKNGSGKTGAFSVGSVLRIDPAVIKPQVLVVAHVRELSSQIANVYTKLCKYTDINVTNFTITNQVDGVHVVVTTLGKLANNLKKRGNSASLTSHNLNASSLMSQMSSLVISATCLNSKRFTQTISLSYLKRCNTSSSLLLMLRMSRQLLANSLQWPNKSISSHSSSN